MVSLREELKDEATFVMIYVRESNPNTTMFPGIDRPKTLAERTALARRLREEYYPGFAFLVDDLDNGVYEAYGRPRTATFVIDSEGVVRYKAAWAPPAQVRRALQGVLGAAPAATARAAESARATQSAGEGKTSATTLRIEGMLCQGCVIAVRSALEAVPGVIRADVDLARRQARVEYRMASVRAADLVAAVEDTGFGAVRARR